jgi:hypothetical protein
VKRPTLCVDFDGVIHSYTSAWIDEKTIPDPPVPGALRWLWEATKLFKVVIYSSRSKLDEGRVAMLKWMMAEGQKEFGLGHPMSGFDAEGGPVEAPYPIDFAHEKPAAFLTIDDRAIQFNGDWSSLDPEKLRLFKPWNKP